MYLTDNFLEKYNEEIENKSITECSGFDEIKNIIIFIKKHFTIIEESYYDSEKMEYIKPYVIVTSDNEYIYCYSDKQLILQADYEYNKKFN